MKPSFKALLVGVCIASVPHQARAGRLIYHYGPADSCGSVVPTAAGPAGVSAEQTSYFGLMRDMAPPPPRSTHAVTFIHPYTGMPAIVPLRLPDATPRMEFRPDRAIYNYGSYAVEVHFLSSGGVDVIYNSGLFRAP
jgi:hypothetical protein